MLKTPNLKITWRDKNQPRSHLLLWLKIAMTIIRFTKAPRCFSPIKKMILLSLFLSYTASILFVPGGRPIQKFLIWAALRDTKDPSRLVLQKCAPFPEKRATWHQHHQHAPLYILTQYRSSLCIKYDYMTIWAIVWMWFWRQSTFLCCNIWILSYFFLPLKKKTSPLIFATASKPPWQRSWNEGSELGQKKFCQNCSPMIFYRM